MPTQAIFLTWATYASWLPGDPRGHWSPQMDEWGHYLGPRHKQNDGDPTTLARARVMAKGPEVTLSTEERNVVATPLSAVARDTPLLACAIEPTHVHLLVPGTT